MARRETAIGKSVTISSLTKVAGFAALILASHNGISTFGIVFSIAVTLSVVATSPTLPALLKLVGSPLELDPQGRDGERRNDTFVAHEKPRRAPGGSLKMLRPTIAAAAAVLAVLSAVSITHAAGENRARSDEVVKEAEAIIMEAGKKNPADVEMINRAIDELHQALKIDPKNDSAYVDLGFCYGVLRDATTAEDMYRTATVLNPSGGNFKELADIYLRTGDSEAALMAANAGLQKNPQDAKLYNAKGLALNDLHRADEAEQAFREAVRLDPSLEVARQNLDALSGKSAPKSAH
jgi:Flp pilus assembly protein TadD